jgi:hypothetical protein
MKPNKGEISMTKLTQHVPFAALAAIAALSVATQGFAQSVPMNHYQIKTTRGTHSGVLVGGSPFIENPGTVSIDAVLIPLIIMIIRQDGTVALFDPMSADSNCGDTDSAESRFRHSPLVVPSDLTFNGVSVGKVQYIDGFMRAQFWNTPTPGSPNRTAYFNPLKWKFEPAFFLATVPSTEGVVNVVSGTSCETGVVSREYFNSLIKTDVLPILHTSGVIAPDKFVMFITKNVSTAGNFSPTSQSSFFGGQHFATGSPAQTWAWAQIKHTSKDDTDIEAASHEIGEWMNDPLLTNFTPSWGHIGEASGCATKLEVGDPLNNIAAPYTLDGYTYHPQQLAFFSWFFNPDGMPSYGAGGKFSSNGKFTEPSTACEN